MKRLSLIILAILMVGVPSPSQSGRRKAPPISPAPSPEPTPTATSKTPEPKTPQVTAEKNQDYRCTDDGTLAHLMDDPESIKAYQTKEVDTRAEILVRPEPKYTPEARQVGVQGVVILKLLLAADGHLDRIRVVRRLPYGLTESAIHAACGIKFNPALKDGQKVSEWFNMEYGFSLAKSSIYGP